MKHESRGFEGLYIIRRVEVGSGGSSLDEVVGPGLVCMSIAHR